MHSANQKSAEYLHQEKQRIKEEMLKAQTELRKEQSKKQQQSKDMMVDHRSSRTPTSSSYERRTLSDTKTIRSREKDLPPRRSPSQLSLPQTKADTSKKTTKKRWKTSSRDSDSAKSSSI